MTGTPVFDGEWTVDEGTTFSDAIREMITYYMPDIRFRIDPSRYTMDRRTFRTAESVWEAVEELAASAGMELVKESGQVWLRHRV